MKMDQALMNLGAAPEVDSVKPLKIEKNEAGEITMQSEQIKYKGGWIQIVSLSSKKNSQSRSVVTYDEKGHISGLEVSFLKENPALEVAEGRKILEACFETLTTKKYNPDEFRFVEIDDGRTMMVWANKHEGQAVYAYLEAYGLGCGTSRLSEAVEKGLIPK